MLVPCEIIIVTDDVSATATATTTVTPIPTTTTTISYATSRKVAGSIPD
jgi:hypothetical protein